MASLSKISDDFLLHFFRGEAQRRRIDIREDVKHIQCPTLVIGTDTSHRGRSVFESWQQTIPNSELAILPLDGYHAAATDPDLTARTTREFIDKHSGT